MIDSITHIFAQQIQSQHNIWIFGLVFAGGVISSLSPCVLGLLPVIIGYVGGYSETNTKRSTVQVLFFVVGLALTLTALGLTAAVTGKALGFNSNPIWSLLIASLIMIMGLSLLEIIEINMPAVIKQMPSNKSNSIILYPMLVGALFAIASSPCSTPVLAGIMAYVSLKSNLAFGSMLLFSFALGQGVILVFAGLFTSLFKKMTYIKKASTYFVKFSGIILILASIYLYLEVFQII